MKKAKEYAAQFMADPTEQTLVDIAKAFVLEVKEIGELRHVQSNEALFAIFDEQDRKWKAFARRIDGIKPNGFELLVKDQFPLAYIYWRGPLRQITTK